MLNIATSIKNATNSSLLSYLCITSINERQRALVIIRVLDNVRLRALTPQAFCDDG